MLLDIRTYILSPKIRPKVTVCLVVLLLGVLLPGETVSGASDQRGNDQKENKESLQRLPDQSFAVIEKGPNGTVVRLLPHHDNQGKLVLPWLENSMSQIFSLDPNHRAEAREHLLKDYYETE
ncbi:MAG: hypothetical protein AB1611_17500 [bacterium]